MRKFKKIIIVTAIIGVLGTAGTAIAASTITPAEILANLTGKTVQEVYDERAEGKSFAFIANEDGKLEDFRSEMLEQRKEILDQRVKEGVLTQEEADEIYQTIKDNQANYNSSGYTGWGRGYGSCHGRGNMMGFGRGRGMGYGMGFGQGRGMGYGWRN
ncbi:MAG: DUF2680 domain-containing protein [Clostridiales bacterium]|jgi:hypothetical protein|nr:DUF2680 domain-containing protein [Clostridiales bacterium]